MTTISPENLFAFCIFAFVSCITPGPNNLMVLTSGLTYGFKRSVPHITGISIGFGLMVFITGLGIHKLFVEYPRLQTLLKLGACAYFFWFAYKLATAIPANEGNKVESKPMSFLGAVAFQWINPKAWVMALGALAAYLPASSSIIDVALLAVIYGVLCFPCVGIWAGFGTTLNKFLKTPEKVRLFNKGVAILLLLSLYPILFE